MRNNGRRTEARYRSYVFSVLRSGSRRWPPKYETLKQAFIERKINKKTGKLAAHYKCAKCKQLFPAKDVQVDHVKPIINPNIGFESYDRVVEGMYCDSNNLQVLCKDCHNIKTKKEKEDAKRRRSLVTSHDKGI